MNVEICGYHQLFVMQCETQDFAKLWATRFWPELYSSYFDKIENMVKKLPRKMKTGTPEKFWKQVWLMSSIKLLFVKPKLNLMLTINKNDN